MKPPFKWNDANTEQARKLYVDQGLSAGRVAAMIGAPSRNSIIGRMHRQGFLLPDVDRHHRMARPNIPRPSRAPPKPKPAPKRSTKPMPVSPPPPPAAIPLMQLTSRTCRWPLGDPHEPRFGFCGARVPHDAPYCCEHRAIAYQPAKPHRRSA